MQAKSFFIASLVVIGVVAVVTSLIGVSLFQRPLLPAYGDEDVGQITMGSIGNINNVIVIDSIIVAGISDVVDFGTVTPGNDYSTSSVICNTGANSPCPFVIRNEGNIDSNIQAYLSSDLFDPDLPNPSNVYVWAEEADSTDAGFAGLVDSCSGSCLNVAPICDSVTDACEIPVDADGPGVGLDPRVDITNGLNFEDCKDEAYLNIGLDISFSEIGAHSADFVVVGTQSINTATIAC